MKTRFLIYFISIFFLNLIHISAEQFKYLSEEIRVLDNGNIILGKNGVEIQIGKYLFISAENFKYSKDLGKLEIFENVKFEDKLNRIYASGKKIIYNESLEIIELIDDVKVNDQINKINLISSKIIYDRKKNLLQFEEKTKFEDRINKIIGSSSKIFYSLKNQKIYSKSVTSINYDNEYDITFEDFEYDIKNKKISSKYLTNIKDKSENNFEINGFEFNPKINRFIGQELKFTDLEKNKYSLKDVMINTSNKKIMGRDLDVKFNKLIFNNNKNDPRMSAKSVKIDKKSSILKKGVFTSCSDEHDCPPWSIYAEEIEHDKKENLIKYKNAWLKIYDVPTVYFPRFSHPDPTVKRKSGFLAPKLSNSKNIGTSVHIPYYYVVSDNKDFTFKPTVFFNDEIVLQTEYRQVNKSSNHIIDFSLNPNNYLSSNSSTNIHLFSNSKFAFENNFFETSDVNINIQKVNNDEYLNTYKINSFKEDYDNNLLHSYIDFKGEQNNFYLNTSLEIYENLEKDKTSRYEFIYPQYNLEKQISYENGNGYLKTYGSQRQYDTNIYEGIIINDFLFEGRSNYSKNGFVSNLKTLIKNVNVDANNSEIYKDEFEQSIAAVFQYNSQYPLFKESSEYNNNLTPKFSLMYSPNKTKNLYNDDKRIDNSNIFSLNRIANNETVEGGASLTYGLNFKKVNKKNNLDVLNLDISSLVRIKENLDLPKTSTLGKKSSDIFGNIQMNLNKNIDFKYNFALDNNFNKTNYDSFSTTFSLNKLVTTFEYFDEKNNSENESFTSNYTTLKLDDNNSINFSLRRNNELSATEYYNLIYNYKNDCLMASVKFKKEYYKDSDLEPEKEIFFELSLLPFTR